ncbi:hypothetical protein BGX30_013699 [Mortierella sp. GBA39]|nr:hypothetical protein BGX30_013699 [Mortierella sp. GBA39]
MITHASICHVFDPETFKRSKLHSKFLINSKIQGIISSKFLTDYDLMLGFTPDGEKLVFHSEF